MWIFYSPLTFPQMTLAFIDDPCQTLMIALEVVKQWLSISIISSTFINWYCFIKRLSFSYLPPPCTLQRVSVHTVEHTHTHILNVIRHCHFSFMFKLSQLWSMRDPWSQPLWRFVHVLVFWLRKINASGSFFTFSALVLEPVILQGTMFLIIGNH